MDHGDELPIDLQRETAALRRVARGILFEPALAEDAVQEAWLAALHARPAMQPSGGWLTEAVRRIAHGMRRAEGRRDRREHAGARHEAVPSAAETAERVELLRELLTMLAELDEPYRSAVQMRLVDDLPPREIAARLSVPVETARTWVKRGVGELRARLDAKHARKRGEFLAVLAPLAGVTDLGLAAVAGSSAKTVGGWIVGTKTKLAVAAAVLVATCVLLTQPWTTTAEGTGPHANGGVVPERTAGLSPTETPVESVATGLEVEPARTRVVEPDARARTGGWTIRGHAKRGRNAAFPGAQLEVRVERGYEAPGEELHAELVTTGSDGAFALELAPPDTAVRVVLRAKTDGHVGFQVEELVLRGASAPTGLVIVLYPLDVLVHGSVLDVAGKPIVGAKIDGIASKSTSDREGRFVYTTSSQLEKEYLTAYADGFAESQTVVQVAGRARIDGVELRLEKSLLLRGRVTDEAGQPIEGAVVEGPSFVRRSATTGADGRFVLDGLKEQEEWLALWIDAPGFVRLRRDFEDRKVPAEEVEFVLERGLEIPGRVVDENGAPLPGALVFAGDSRHDDGSSHRVAGDEGRFVLRRVTRSLRQLGAEYEGFAPTVIPIELPARGPFVGEVEIRLDRGHAADGLVVDPDGKPVDKAAVYLRAGSEYVGSVSSQTDAEGRFRIVGMPRGKQLAFEVAASGFVRANAPFDPTTKGVVRIELQRAAGLAGVVVDAATKKPIQRFRVRFVPATLEKDDEPLSGYNAFWLDPGVDVDDEQGRWQTRHEELVAGEVTGLEISAPGYGPTIVPRAVTSFDFVERPIQIELSSGATVTGRVVEAASGRPVAGATVWRTTERDPLGPWESYTQRSARKEKTNELGEFVFEGLPLEPMRLYVEVAGFAPGFDGPFEVSSNTAPRKIELHRGATLRGRLLDSKGLALADEPVQVTRNEPDGRSEREWSLVTDRAGRFELTNLAPGKYSASRELRWERGATFDLSTSIEIGAVREYELELRPRGTGRIVGSIPGAENRDTVFTVSASRAKAVEGEGPVWRAALARDGRFEIDGVEAGHWMLHVSSTGDSRARETTVAEVEVFDAKESAVEVVP